MSYEVLGVDVYHILSWFIVYSFLGWIWESCYVSVKNKRWVNRGFVNGPFVTIYGVGAVAVYVILRPFTGRVLELYFAGVAVATVLEYVTGVLMEAIFHANWWDYSDKKFNFQGKICLGSSIAWGFFTLILFYILQPMVSSFVDWIPRSTGMILIYVWLVYYVVDFSFSAAAAFDLHSKLQKLEGVLDEFQESFQNSRLYEAVEEFREKAEVYRPEFTDSKIKEYLEERREKFHEILERLEDTELSEKREAFMQRYDETAHRYLEVKKSIRYMSRRHMKAYPNLISKAARLKKSKEKKKK